MELSDMLCLRILSIISLPYAYRNSQKKIIFPSEIRLQNKPDTEIFKTKHGKRYSHADVYQNPAFDHSLSRNHSDSHQMKIYSIGTDQTQNQNVNVPSGSVAKRKTLTVWMSSLIFHGRGLTVYDSGKVTYRIDYQEKHSKEVLLMDHVGKDVFTIRRKILGLRSLSWEGYRGSKSSASSGKTPSFQVKERLLDRVLARKSSMYEVISEDSSRYSLKPCKNLKSSNTKFECKIVNAEGKTIAELKQKHGHGGIPLGRDVLSLEVEAGADVSFVVALVAVFGLIKCET